MALASETMPVWLAIKLFYLLSHNRIMSSNFSNACVHLDYFEATDDCPPPFHDLYHFATLRFRMFAKAFVRGKSPLHLIRRVTGGFLW